MPTFYAENIDIDVDEFIDSCSRKEINELIDYLVEDGYVIKVTGIKQSVPEAEFNQLLDKLSQNRLRLTNEEEELLKKIASRF
jgi:hypothetical protein